MEVVTDVRKKGRLTDVSPFPAQRVLVVDDASEVRFLLNLTLRREGYQVMAAAAGTEALSLVQREGLPDLALLDMMIPDMDGSALAGQLQQIGDVPIICLSALTDTETKVQAISHFAEDYVTKPFVVSELLARVRRVLLRGVSGAQPHPEIPIDEHLSLNFVKQYAVADGVQIPLTPIECRLLHALYQQRGRVLSPGLLVARVWDSARRGSVEALWVHMRRLRNKIEMDPRRPRYLVTVRGRGYYLPHAAEAGKTGDGAL